MDKTLQQTITNITLTKSKEPSFNGSAMELYLNSDFLTLKKNQFVLNFVDIKFLFVAQTSCIL